MPMVVCRGLLTTLCMLPSAVVAAALEWREGEDARLLVWFKRAAEKAQIKDTSAEILAHMDIDSLVRMIGRLNIKPNNAQSWVLDLLFEVLFKMNTTKAASCLRKLYSQEMLPTILEYGSDHGGNPSKIGEIQCMINITRGPSDASDASRASDAPNAVPDRRLQLSLAREALDVTETASTPKSNNSQVMHFSPCLRIVASIVYHGAKSMFYVQDETDDLVSPTSSEKEWGRRVQTYKRQSQYRKDREEEQKRRRL